MDGTDAAVVTRRMAANAAALVGVQREAQGAAQAATQAAAQAKAQAVTLPWLWTHPLDQGDYLEGGQGLKAGEVPRSRSQVSPAMPSHVQLRMLLARQTASHLLPLR